MWLPDVRTLLSVREVPSRRQARGVRPEVDARAALSQPIPSGEGVDNAEPLRGPPLWLAPLARLAAAVTAVVVLTRTAGDEGVDHDLLALLLHVAG